LNESPGAFPTLPTVIPDPDITQARTLPGSFYTDPALFASQKDRVFTPSWQFITDEATAVRIPGQVYPFTLLEGCLDEPLLLARGTDDAVRCMSNVCTHRGTLVCEAPGNERHLRCRYHGRRFALDGTFQFMPEFEACKGFPTEEDNLRRLPLERLGPLLFTSLAPACPFGEWIRPVIERVGWLPLHEFRLDPSHARDYLVACNWALYCENYLEGFHIPFVHASLNDVLDYGAYATELHEHGSLQLGVSKDDGGEAVFNLPSISPDTGKRVAAYYFHLWPNLMLNFYPWGLSINVVRPLGVDRTRVSFIPYVWRPDLLERGAGAGLDRVEREDEAVVEAVQKGLRSRLYSHGRYSPTREQGVHHFHRLLARHAT